MNAAFIKLLVGITLFGVFGVFCYSLGKTNVRAKWDAEKVAQAKEYQAAEALNRAKEQAQSKKLIEAKNAATKRETILRGDADRARSELDGLRDELKTVCTNLPGDTADACTKRAATVNELFGQCAARYTGLAAKADRHASDSLMLQQAWPK